MSIPYSGSTGAYYNRQGAIIGEFNRVAAQYGSPLSTGFNSIWVQFASSDQAAVQNLPGAVSLYEQSGQQYQNTLQQDGALASQLQVSDYYSVVPYTLQQSLVVLGQQMVIDSQTIQRATLGSTVTAAGTNLGNATVVVNTKDRFGNPINAIIPETIRVTCISAGTQFQETLQAVGQSTVPPTDPTWPSGSGCNVQFAITDPAATNSQITDGAIQQWGGTGNDTPTNWTIVNGNAGVTVFRGTANPRASLPYCAQITSDGSSLTAIAQNLANPQTNTVYAVTYQAKISASDGSGTVVISLTDDNGTVLQDDAGNNLSYSRNMSAQVTTSWQLFTAYFVTPRQLPAFTRIQVGFGAAPSAAKNLFISLVGIVASTPLYNGGIGPTIAAFANTAPTAVGDYYTAAMTNSLTTQSFAVGMNRLYNTLSLGINLPSANSPTVSDTLVSH